MIINHKMNQSLVDQTLPIKNKIHGIQASQSSKLKVSIIKFKKPKKVSFFKQQKTKTQEESKMEQNSFSQKNSETQILFNQPMKLQTRNKGYGKKLEQNENDTKQTFKDFIKKVQTYNKKHLIKKTLNQEETQQNQSTPVTQQLLAKPIPKTTIQNYLSSYPIESIQKDQNPPLISHQNDKKPNFIIHEKTSNSFYNRSYRRSKTEQQIKTQLIDFRNSNNKFEEKIDLKRQNFIDSINVNDECCKSIKQNSKQLKYISLKLMQKGKTLQNQQKPQQHYQSSISFHSLSNKRKIKQKDLQKHKKLLETKFSKIRIRFGSSLYNKNLWTIDSSNVVSRQKLKRQVQCMSSQELMGTIHNKGKSKFSVNSEFCQNKILQAQNIFIQKRRLLPTASTKSRNDISKTKKQFFAISSSLNRYKTDEFEKLPITKKGQNINGWQIDDQGPTQYKIQHFF